MRTFLILSVASFFFGTFSSCAYVYHIPNDNIMVQMKEKNELQLSGGVAFHNKTEHGGSHFPTNMREHSFQSSFQLGYSPLKHLSIAGSYESKKNTNLEQNNLEHKSSIWQAAIGTYHFSPKDLKKSKGILVDLFVGYSEGNIVENFSTGAISEIAFQRYFIQTGLYYKSKYLDVGGNLKYSILNYHNPNHFYNYEDEDLSGFEQLLENNPSNPWQISFKISTGFPVFKVHANVNCRINTTTYYNSPIDILSPRAFIGVDLNIHKLLQEISREKSD